MLPRTWRFFQNALKKQRLLTAASRTFGLPLLYSPHSFRVTTLTELFEQGVHSEDVQHLAGHAEPRSMWLYDRRERKIKRNIVERISV